MSNSASLTPKGSMRDVKSPRNGSASLVSSPGSPRVTPTRTVAIIKPHALEHRFDIEQRITEASFEIVKERQMEFDVETDPGTLIELFGDDAQCFSEGPVWVYVLERRRAVEVWHTVMGDADPAVARTTSPGSLRALFGKSKEQNAVMGSPDIETAEIQIASLFASSPPFPASELPEDGMGTLKSVSSSVLSSLRRSTSQDAPSVTSGGGSVHGRRASTFKARVVPTTTASPSIVPRTTRAADLRAGIKSDKSEQGPRKPLDKEKLTKIFANTPGHKRRETIAVASTADPAIAPRMTRAAALRLGITPPAAARAKTTPAETFDGVPGHKRRESISVVSTRAPTVAPRPNKAAELRLAKKNGTAPPPTSYQFRSPSTPRAPSLSRSTSISSLVEPELARGRPSSVQPPRTPLSRAASLTNGHGKANGTPPSSFKGGAPPSSFKGGAFARDTSASARPPSTVGRPPSTTPSRPPSATPKPRPSSLQAPSVAPRQNKAAELRLAKKLSEASSVKGSPIANGRSHFR